MSGRVDSTPAVEIGLPPLTIWKCGVGVATNRDTNTWCTPPTVSSQVTQGAVGLAGFIVPAATRGSSASLAGSLFSEQACSALREPAQVLAAFEDPVAGVADHVPVKAADDAGAGVGLGLRREHHARCRPGRPCPGPVSYHTTHGTLSLAPVNAMSGSIPSRLTSTFRLGSAPPGPTRCNADLLEAEPADRGDVTGRVRHAGRGHAVTVGRARPQRLGDEDLVLAGRPARSSVSCHVTHGPGLVGSTAEPPATDGFSAL